MQKKLNVQNTLTTYKFNILCSTYFSYCNVNINFENQESKTLRNKNYSFKSCYISRKHTYITPTNMNFMIQILSCGWSLDYKIFLYSQLFFSFLRMIFSSYANNKEKNDILNKIGLTRLMSK